MGKNSKRKGKSSSQALNDTAERKNKKNLRDEQTLEETFDNLKFEDPFEDEFEKEDIVNEDEVAALEEKTENKENLDKDKKAWTPNAGLGENEVLEVDESAYKMLHNVGLEWPSLTFDFVKDELGNNRTRFPHSMTCVVGSQAGDAARNSLKVIKMESLSRVPRNNDENMSSDEEDSDSDDDDDGVEADPILQFLSIPHDGGVNRIRCNKTSNFVASWSDNRKVYIYDIRPQLKALDTHVKVPSLANRPAYSYNGHSTEGYAIAWHPEEEFTLISGDCYGAIHLWKGDNTTGNISFDASRFYKPPTKDASVEDLVWSPSEKTVFAAADTAGFISIFDTRAPNKCMIKKQVSTTDVNVLAWSHHVTNLLACGCDDGEMSVWDLRTFASNNNKQDPLARFTYSETPITSLEWHPTDESMLCVTDDVATYLYDLSIEDDDVKQNNDGGVEVPPQLLFLHCGSEMVKEAHWHSQIPSCVMTTSLSGLSAFIPSNL